ncbi:hypothetical protein [Thermus oshimai]|uniref:hypothetical protein n=1 Tax=Thermus oshimai TaxID=56957 RepID=UPI0011819292|nr:hypothetical protein [Thermus oshimai]
MLRMDEEKVSMEERIQAFYRQSGGPLNPQIPKLIEKHLLYGKDHGPPGRKETLMDVFNRWMAEDPSVQFLVGLYLQNRMRRDSLEVKVAALERELRTLREELNTIKCQLSELRALLSSSAGQ